MKSLNLDAPISALFQDRYKATNAVNSINNSNIALNADSNMGFNTDIKFSNAPDDVKFNNLDMNSFGGNNAINTYAGYYWNYWEPYNHYYHNCYHTFTSADKFETAFKLARKLMDKKMVKPMKTIEDFFKLMDAIVEVL